MVLSGWSSADKFRCIIDSTKVGTTMSGVPVLINITSSGVGTTNYDCSAIFTELGADYRKIAVEFGNTNTQCYVEVAKWGQLSQIPQASGTNIGLESPSYTGGAFDGAETDYNATGSWYAYYSSAYQVDGWVGKDYGPGAAHIVQRADFKSYSGSAGYDPHDFTFDGSNDGTNWTILHSVLGHPTNAAATWYSFEFYNVDAYRYYRMNVTANNGGGYCIVAELKFYEWLNDNSAQLWVGVPLVSHTTNTDLYLYYDSTHEPNDTGDIALLIKSDTDDESQVFEDSSPFPKSIDAQNEIKHDSAQAKWGATSVKGDGAGDQVQILGTNAELELKGDFTIHCWVYLVNGAGSWSFVNYATTNKLHALYADDATSARVIVDGSNVITGMTPTGNTWEHYALVRSGNTLTAYFDGAVAGSTTSTITLGATTVNYAYGSASATHSSHGWTDELVVINGKALWQTAFSGSLPTGPVEPTYVGRTGSLAAAKVWDEGFVFVGHLEQPPLGQNTDGVIIDSTRYKNNGVPKGTMTNDDLITGPIGNQVDFDGVDDYIDLGTDSSILEATGTTGITLEAIVGGTFSGSDSVIARDQPSNRGFDWRTWSDTRMMLETAGQASPTIATTGMTLNEDNHIAVTNSGTLVKHFLNGAENGAGHNTSTIPANTAITSIACRVYSGYYQYWPGTIDEVRVSKVVRSPDWLSLTYYSNSDTLLEVESADPFTWVGAPSGDEKVYGANQILTVTPTIEEGAGTHAHISFYSGQPPGTLITTKSGIASGTQTTASLETASATTYYWYVTGTVSGTSNAYYSTIYSFYVRYLCSGTCTAEGTGVSGVKINIHNRDTGALIGSTTSAGTDGIFQVESTHGGQHYAVALHPNETYNGLIYDRIIPD